MKCLSAVCLLLFVGVTLADEKPAFDTGKLAGEWKYVSGMRSGKKVEEQSLSLNVTFAKDKVTVPAGPTEKFIMAYKIDASKSPATIDMEIKDGPVKEGKAKGIIAFDGDTLKLCYTAEGDRPEKFESTEKNKAFFFVLKKAK